MGTQKPSLGSIQIVGTFMSIVVILIGVYQWLLAHMFMAPLVKNGLLIVASGILGLYGLFTILITLSKGERPDLPLFVVMRVIPVIFILAGALTWYTGAGNPWEIPMNELLISNRISSYVLLATGLFDLWIFWPRSEESNN